MVTKVWNINLRVIENRLLKNVKWHLVGHKRLKYQFEGYWEPCFDENVKNTKWHLVGHKRLKFQFEGYWEPCFDENVKNTKWHLVGHKKGLNFNLRVIENRLQSIHFICMNNDFVSHEKALPTDSDCLPLIKKGLSRHVM
jgi:hypothetical protein